MPYTAIQLITDAFYDSGIRDATFNVPSADDSQRGLRALNQVLNLTSVNLDYIPYFNRGTFTAISGVGEYVIQNVYLIDLLTFNFGEVRYNSKYMTRFEFFGTNRANNIQSLPFSYTFERQLNGIKLFLYPAPDQDYFFEYSGKIKLTNPDYSTDLTQFFDDFFIQYLEFETALLLCAKYGATPPQMILERVQELRQIVSAPSPVDMTMKTTQLLSNGNWPNWAQITIGRGWVP